MSEAKEVFQRNRSLFLFLIGLFICCILIFVLWQPLLPFLIGLLIAYIFLPIVDWVDRRMPFKHKGKTLQRVLIILLTFIILLVIIGVLGYFTFSSLSSAFATLPATIGQGIEDLGKWFDSQVQLFSPSQQKQIYETVQSIGVSMGTWMQNSIASGISLIFSTFTFILGFFTLPFFLVFFMTSFHEMQVDFKSALPAGITYHAANFFKIMNNVFGRYIRAQILIAIIIGTIVTISLEIMNIELGLALGFIAGAFQLIPTIGGFIAAVIGILATLATAPDQILWVTIMYIIVNLVIASILIAKLSGEAVKMNAAIILVLVVIGGFLGGIAGIILIVPLVAVIWALYKYVIEEMGKTKIAEPDESSGSIKQ